MTTYECKQSSEQRCEVNPRCEWHPYPWLGCDLREANFYKTILDHSEIIQLLARMKEGTNCLAFYEKYDRCLLGTCRMEYGICRLNHTHHPNKPEYMHELVGKICHQLPAQECVAPCINHTQVGSSWCRGPSALPQEFYNPKFSRDDYSVYGLMLQLNGDTYLTEMGCNALDDNETACMLSEP
eukprot:3891466-Amphidinium_carterae.1